MRQLLFCILSLLLFGKAEAQSGIPYLNHTSEWSFKGGGVGFFGDHDVIRYRYYFNGDTTINAHIYYKVFGQGVDSSWDANQVVTVASFNDYAAALREEGQKFYVIRPSDSSDVLLYNFDFVDLMTGLPMDASVSCQSSPGYPTTTIVHLGTTPLYRYQLNNPNATKRLIEGVGGEGDLLEQGSLCGIGYESERHLVCYKKDNNLLVVDSNATCGSTLQPGGPNCQANFCYSLSDSGGLGFITFYNTATTNLPGDSIVAAWIYSGEAIGPASNFSTYSFIYANPGIYSASSTIYTASGCSNTIVIPINSSIPANTCVTTSLNTIGNNSPVAIYPTLIHTTATIIYDNSSGIATLLLYDAAGMKVKEQRLNGGTSTLNRNGLRSGMYFYAVVVKDKVMKKGKLIFD